MNCAFILCLLVFLGCTFLIEGKKRILLNDPDVVAERMNRFEQTVAQLKADNLQLETRLQQVLAENHQNTHLIQTLQSSFSKLQNGGSTYIRWGRTVCPNNSTELVYAGYAGGGMYGHAGTAAEAVCLPRDPNFGKTSGPDYCGHMYGAEFETSFWASNSADEDVPCAVCRNPHTVSSIMIPGKNVCYSGWNLEYYGYLSSGYWNYPAPSSYNCVDISPEYVTSGAEDRNGKLFYSVLAKCGSLPCPPYVNNYPLTCVVCSK